MKRLALLPLAILVLFSAGCNRHGSAQEMLQDENDRRQVYNTILENEAMRNEFMTLMRERNLSGPMGGGGMMHGRGMVGDTAGMAALHRQQMQNHMKHMMQLCESDTAACNEMSRMMLQHPGMMSSMKRRMQQHGMFDTSSMQQRKRHRMNP
jgi:hypothetical protein